MWMREREVERQRGGGREESWWNERREWVSRVGWIVRLWRREGVRLMLVSARVRVMSVGREVRTVQRISSRWLV